MRTELYLLSWLPMERRKESFSCYLQSFLCIGLAWFLYLMAYHSSVIYNARAILEMGSNSAI